MTRHQVRPHAKGLQQVKQPHVGRTQGGLGYVCLGQRLLLRTLLFLTEGRGRENVRTQRPGELAGQDAISQLKSFTDFGEVDRQVAQHVGILGALAGEQEGDLALPSQRLFGKVDSRVAGWPGGRVVCP